MKDTPLRVIDRAAPADPFIGPAKGKRFVAVEVRLQNVGSVVYRDFPSNGAVLVDTRSRQYQSTLWDVKAGPALAQTTIAQGDKRIGFITFEVPSASARRGSSSRSTQGWSRGRRVAVELRRGSRSPGRRRLHRTCKSTARPLVQESATFLEGRRLRDR